jgi:threonine/homoserine/homoserine lactone efflux protein
MHGDNLSPHCGSQRVGQSHSIALNHKVQVALRGDAKQQVAYNPTHKPERSPLLPYRQGGPHQHGPHIRAYSFDIDNISPHHLSATIHHWYNLGMIFAIARGVALGFSAAIIPGPFQAYLLSQTMKIGWRRTLPAAFAPLLSDGPIIILVLFILAQVPSWLLTLLHIGGGLFILFLGWRAYQAFRTVTTTDSLTEESTAQSFFKAVLVNFFSPGPYIFWSLVTGPLFLENWSVSPWWGIAFLASFYTGFIGVLLVLVALFALARETGPRVVRVLLGVSSLALAFFGMYQFLSGVLG